jgi:hypothetical protein
MAWPSSSLKIHDRRRVHMGPRWARALSERLAAAKSVRVSLQLSQTRVTAVTSACGGQLQ